MDENKYRKVIGLPKRNKYSNIIVNDQNFEEEFNYLNSTIKNNSKYEKYIKESLYGRNII